MDASKTCSAEKTLASLLVDHLGIHQPIRMNNEAQRCRCTCRTTFHASQLLGRSALGRGRQLGVKVTHWSLVIALHDCTRDARDRSTMHLRVSCLFLSVIKQGRRIWDTQDLADKVKNNKTGNSFDFENLERRIERHLPSLDHVKVLYCTKAEHLETRSFRVVLNREKKLGHERSRAMRCRGRSNHVQTTMQYVPYEVLPYCTSCIDDRPAGRNQSMTGQFLACKLRYINRCC